MYETMESMKKIIDTNKQIVADTFKGDGQLIYVEGSLYLDEYVIETPWEERPRAFRMPKNMPRWSDVWILDLKYGKLREAKSKLAKTPKDENRKWDIIDGLELSTETTDLEKFIKNNDELVFVNGDVYKGKVIFDRYKGIGWLGGRTADIELGDKLDEHASVCVVDLHWGKIRRCVFNPQRIYPNRWTLVDDPDTVLAKIKDRGIY